MNGVRLLAAGACAAVCGAGVYAAAPSAPPPIASYWMDVATTSGLGAGFAGGGRPSAGQIMAMMRGGSSLGHTLDLRLASKQKAAAAPQADHLIPPGLQMGASLPLLTPTVVKSEPTPGGIPAQFQRPKGRMLIYWGCGEHAGANQPMVIDFAKVTEGKMPPGFASAMASMAHVVSGPNSAPGFGRWPNERDSRAVPVAGSLLGAHKVEANYAPPISFSLGAGQDFMPGLGLREAGALPSGASRLQWNPAAQATGYALAMFGSNGNGDVVMWSSAKSATMPAMDYLAPAEVRRLVTAGSVLPASANECVLPAEVAAASPAGMVMMIGYGPEANFAEAPKAPKWVAKVRYKTTASLMRGMGGFGGPGDEDSAEAQQPQQQDQQQPRRKRGGFGDLLKGAVGIPH
jgi:hypothetical protein